VSVVLSLLRQKLADVGAEGAADSLECLVEAGGQSVHAGGGAECDQSNDQGIFNQILTLFTAGQILELDIELQKDPVACRCELGRSGQQTTPGPAAHNPRGPHPAEQQMERRRSKIVRPAINSWRPDGDVSSNCRRCPCCLAPRPEKAPWAQ
jgi:hypothetical protein